MPKVKTKKKRRPKHRFPTRKSFEIAINEVRGRITEYDRLRRNGWQRFSRQARDEIDKSETMCLWLNNYDARIYYYDILRKHVSRLLRSFPDGGDLAHVTLISPRDSVRLVSLPYYDFTKVQQWTREVLDGCDFVGIVEAGYFPSKRTMWGPREMADLHSHCLLLNPDIESLEALSKAVNADPLHQSAASNVRAMHVQRYKRNDFRRVLRYMLKAQLSQYATWPISKRNAENITEGLSRLPSGIWSLKKTSIRTGNAVKMANALVGRTLDKTVFAGGKRCEELVAAVNQQAVGPYWDWAERQSWFDGKDGRFLSGLLDGSEASCRLTRQCTIAKT